MEFQMAALQGTILASKIVPTDSLDTYATHDDKYGRGGHRSVDTIVERDEITPERRKEGMTVYVKENKTKYILENGIDKVNNLEWNDWVLVKRDFINVNGVSIPMNVYRGFNKINGALTINWGR